MTDELDIFGEDSVRERLAAFLNGRNGVNGQNTAVLGNATGAPIRIEKLRRFTVGFSWLTYGFDAHWQDANGAQHNKLILRIGPPNGIFGPYKASTQFFAQQVLENTPVPVPRVYWHSDSSELFGAPFFICERVAGDAPIPWNADFTDEVRETLAEQFVGAVAALHNFDWRGTPVADSGADITVANAALKQIEFYEELLAKSRLRQLPAVAWAVAWLRNNCPTAPRVSMIHGDYRIGNFLEEGGRITAILDWELTHLGDPHEDIGFIALRAWSGKSPYLCQLIKREDLYRRYEELTGIKVDPQIVAFYEVFNNFKLFAIHAAAAGCFEAGKFNDLRMPAMGAQIPRVLLQLERMIEGVA